MFTVRQFTHTNDVSVILLEGLDGRLVSFEEGTEGCWVSEIVVLQGYAYRRFVIEDVEGSDAGDSSVVAADVYKDHVWALDVQGVLGKMLESCCIVLV